MEYKRKRANHRLSIVTADSRGDWALCGMLTYSLLARSTSFTSASAASGPENCYGRPSLSTWF